MSSIIEITKARADLFDKAQQMLQHDLKATAQAESEFDDDEYQKSLEDQHIKDKIDQLKHEKTNALNSLEDIYNNITKVQSRGYESLNKSDLILRNQKNEITRNVNKLSNIKSDVITKRRQVEIAEDETRRRNNRIFVLKTSFLFFSLCTVPLVLLINGILGKNNALMLIVVLMGFYATLMIMNFLSTRNRHILNWNVRKQSLDKLPKGLLDERALQVSDEGGYMTANEILAEEEALLEEKMAKSKPKGGCGLVPREEDLRNGSSYLIVFDMDDDDAKDLRLVNNMLGKCRFVNSQWACSTLTEVNVSKNEELKDFSKIGEEKAFKDVGKDSINFFGRELYYSNKDASLYGDKFYKIKVGKVLHEGDGKGYEQRELLKNALKGVDARLRGNDATEDKLLAEKKDLENKIKNMHVGDKKSFFSFGSE